MGKLKGNIFEGISGSLSNLVFYEVNGRRLVRTKPSGYRDCKSLPQLIQRKRMSTVQQCLRAFRLIIKRYYTQVASGKTAYGEAVAWHMRNALVGDYPGIEMDFSKVQVARGVLMPPAFTLVNCANGKLLLEWNYALPLGGSGRDYLRVIELPMGQQIAFELNVMAQRSFQSATIDVENEQSHYWAFYYDIHTGAVSNSVYLGCL